MTPDSKEFMEENRPFVEIYQRTNVPRHMPMRDREKLLKIVKEELKTNINPDLWCEECLKAFVQNAYSIYDKYLTDEKRKH